MAVAAFDTLKYAKQLKQAGFSDEQAEARVVALAEALQASIQQLATKTALDEFRHELKREIGELRQEMKHDIDHSRQEAKQAETGIRGDIALIRWMLGANFAIGIAIFVRLFFFR